jgi:hypothetical protein
VCTENRLSVPLGFVRQCCLGGLRQTLGKYDMPIAEVITCTSPRA